MSFKHKSGPANQLFERVARIVHAKPQHIRGVLVVAIPESGSAGIVHNACCVLHMLDAVRAEVEANPQLNLVNEADRESHGL